MYKQIFIQFLGLILLIIIVSCSTKKEGHEGKEEHDATSEDWKEMDDFHMIMAESFHPYKDSADLEPAKQNATALIESAEKWANAPLPEKFKEDEEIKFKVTQLKADALKFAEVVKTEDSKAIGESLTKLHDLFHEIQEAWYGAAGEEHH